MACPALVSFQVIVANIQNLTSCNVSPIHLPQPSQLDSISALLFTSLLEQSELALSLASSLCIIIKLNRAETGLVHSALVN